MARTSKLQRSLLCKGGAASLLFAAVQAVAAVGGGFVELVARDLVEPASCRAIDAFEARKLLDGGVEELRGRGLLEIVNAQHFPRMQTR